MITFFIEPIPNGWVYPCTLEDIEHQLKLVSPEDLKGLCAVGLVPSTNKQFSADGRYRAMSKPTIYLYSYPESLTFRQPAHTKRSDIEHWKAIELEYGMTIREEGSRWICQWRADNLRRFVLEHVLIHEIGHHVLLKKRISEGLNNKPSVQVSEQFADDYAVRWQRSMGLIKH